MNCFQNPTIYGKSDEIKETTLIGSHDAEHIICLVCKYLKHILDDV